MQVEGTKGTGAVFADAQRVEYFPDPGVAGHEGVRGAEKKNPPGWAEEGEMARPR